MKNKLRIVNAPKIATIPLESFTQARIAKEFKKFGWVVVRNRATNIAGWPDLTAYRNGKTVFIEVKRTPEDECTPVQLLVHEQLNMRTPYSAIIIKYPNGATQEVRPNMQYFAGNWDDLAKAVAEIIFP